MGSIPESHDAGLRPNTVGTGRPQISIHKIADKPTKAWDYVPGEHPALDAAIEQHAAVFGTIWSPHLLGPDFITFGEFIRLPEVEKLCPVGSDARLALDNLQSLDCFNGTRNESKTALTTYIRESRLCQEHGRSFRWVQRIFNSIWRNYDGVLGAKEANLKALDGAEESALRQDERRTKDALRKAASRNPDPNVQSARKESTIKRLVDHAGRLRLVADKLIASAESKRKRAKQLRARAKRKHAKAEQIEKEIV